MTAAKKLDLISIETYLAGELVSPVKHEFVGGVVYAMAAGTDAHNAIASNALIALGSQLRGQKCRAFNSDTKIRVRLPSQTRFYYPDVSVVCRPNSPTDSFQDEPVVLIEVLSRATRRLDEGEKRDAYLTINSLSTLLLVEQDLPTIIAYRRQDQGFVCELYEGLEAVVPLDEITRSLSLSEVYDGVTFAPKGESLGRGLTENA